MRIGPTLIRTGYAKGSITSQIASKESFTAATGLTPTLFFPAQESSGNLVDTVSGVNLVPAGTPTRNVSVGSLVGNHYNAGICNHNGDAGDPGAGSLLFGAVATYPSSFPSLPGICGRSSTTSFPCYLMYRANDTLNYGTLLIRDATVSVVVSDGVGNMVTGEPMLWLGHVDRSTNTGRLVICAPDRVVTNASVSIAGVGTLSGGTSPLFAVGSHYALSGGAAVATPFLVLGAQCEGINPVTIAKRLGFGGI